MINIKENEKLSVLNHSGAHLLAHAVKNLYPDALFWVGPVISEGFYYDIDLGNDSIKEEDLAKIETEMRKLVKKDRRISRVEMTKEEALLEFSRDPYKTDLINELSNEEIISAYKQDDFIDLCRGPHVNSTKELKYFKLLKVSGAYFKGDSKNKMLQRIYGIVFETKDELDNHLELLEEAKKRDHKKLGRELGIFMMSEYAPGFPFFLPNGMTIRKELEDYWYEVHNKYDYKMIKTPIMLSKELWETSGHWDNYDDNMYLSNIDNREFAIKPMNCPGGILVFDNDLYSYRDLPLRMGELGLVHRHEASGALNGLFRVRAFTQDDAHLFMTEDMIEDEINTLFKMIDEMYSAFGLEYNIELSTRPEDKYIGSIEVWDKAEATLEAILKKSKKDYVINEGDGAFYGPKLDFQVLDSLGRSWQCGTIQLDLNLPDRFDINYIDKDGSKKRPIMLHRVVYGSIERFIGILIEHFAGAFPLWMAPLQVNVIPVNNEYHLEYANEVISYLKKNGIRVSLDSRDEKLGYKMRESQMMKVPFTLVIGDKEVEDKSVNFRKYGEEKSTSISLKEFTESIQDKIKDRILD